VVGDDRGTLGELRLSLSTGILTFLSLSFPSPSLLPEWNQDQIYDADRPYVWESEYKFSTVDENGMAITQNQTESSFTSVLSSASATAPASASATATSASA